VFRYLSFSSLAFGVALLSVFAQTTPQSLPSQSAPSPSVATPPNAPSARSIDGIVLSRTGESVPGAIVQLKDLKSLQVRSFVAHKDGHYHFYGLSTEVNYQLRAQANGMMSKTKTVSIFNSRAQVHVNLKLDRKLKS